MGQKPPILLKPTTQCLCSLILETRDGQIHSLTSWRTVGEWNWVFRVEFHGVDVETRWEGGV